MNSSCIQAWRAKVSNSRRDVKTATYLLNIAEQMHCRI
jgi:hypothetical protein